MWVWKGKVVYENWVICFEKIDKGELLIKKFCLVRCEWENYRKLVKIVKKKI